jgi:hypothetical protein
VPPSPLAGVYFAWFAALAAERAMWGARTIVLPALKPAAALSSPVSQAGMGSCGE